MTIKKIALLLITLFVVVLTAAAAHAVTWTVTNQSTIGWDAVTTTGQGTDIPIDDTLSYEVYIVKEGADKTTAVKIGDTTELTYVITFEAEGRWLVGVKTIRTPAAAPENKTESTITWSDVTDVVAVPTPFGFVYFEAPADPTGLGPQ